MKKFLMLMLALIMSVSCFAACGGSGAGGGGTNVPSFVLPENGYDGSEVTLKFYHTMGQNLTAVLNKYIEKFNEIYPNIHIEHEQIGGYDDVRSQISTEITAGNQPNIAYCYPDHVALYNVAGVVATLDDLINSKITVNGSNGSSEILGLTDAQKADFIEGYYNEGKAFGDGLMYTMPFSKSTEVLYYNKTFFDANNLKVPTTWDEMEEVCKKIKEIEPSSIPLGYDSEANWFITMCEQMGSPYTSATGEKYLFDNATNRAFVARFREWYQKNYVTTQTLYKAYTSGLFVNTDESKATSYMSIGSSAGATHQRPAADENGDYPFEVGIASIPQIDPSNPKVISQGPSVCIFKKDNPQEVVASWLFVKYLTTNVNFQFDFSTASGYVPVLKSVQDLDAYKNYMSKLVAENRVIKDAEGNPVPKLDADGNIVKDADGQTVYQVESINQYIATLSMKICMDQEEAYYVSPAFNGSSTAREQVESLMTGCFILTGNNVESQIAQKFQEAIDACKYMG